MKYLNRTLLLAFFALTCLRAQDITKGSIVGIVRDARYRYLRQDIVPVAFFTAFVVTVIIFSMAFFVHD